MRRPVLVNYAAGVRDDLHSEPLAGALPLGPKMMHTPGESQARKALVHQSCSYHHVQGTGGTLRLQRGSARGRTPARSNAAERSCLAYSGVHCAWAVLWGHFKWVAYAAGGKRQPALNPCRGMALGPKNEVIACENVRHIWIWHAKIIGAMYHGSAYQRHAPVHQSCCYHHLQGSGGALRPSGERSISE